MLNYLPWFLTSALYSPNFYQLYHTRWEAIDYTHAYFILPVSSWLVWRKRSQLKELFKIHRPQASADYAGISLLIVSLAIFLFGWRQEYLFISTLSLIPLLYGMIIYLYGRAIAKTLSFPILYLLLLVPPPLSIIDSITLPMRYGISVATEAILKAFHYPIVRDGLLLSLGNHEIYMGAPCSGFRSLSTIIALGLIYVYLTKYALTKKVILLASVIPLAILGNLLRVISVCLATFYFGNSAGRKFHDISGFIIFIVLIAGMLGIEKLLNKDKN